MIQERARVYGTITVSDRGQIVIPAQARRDFDIAVGDKLIVLGDPERGLALFKVSALLDQLPDLLDFLGRSGREGAPPEP